MKDNSAISQSSINQSKSKSKLRMFVEKQDKNEDDEQKDMLDNEVEMNFNDEDINEGFEKGDSD